MTQESRPVKISVSPSQLSSWTPTHSPYTVPRMSPILRNRHEKVQEATINLIGRIADRGAEFVPAREWMRICFELLDLLKAHKKGIRRAAVNSFGYIAKSLGPMMASVFLVPCSCSCTVSIPFRRYDSCWGSRVHPDLSHASQDSRAYPSTTSD